MGRKLDTNATLTPTPLVNVRGPKGTTFTGTYMAKRSRKNPYKNLDGTEKPDLNIFEFKVIDGTMEYLVRQGEEYVPTTDVKVGDIVAIMPPTRLNNGLVQAVVGQTLTITALGMGKATKGGGRPYLHDLEVVGE